METEALRLMVCILYLEQGERDCQGGLVQAEGDGLPLLHGVHHHPALQAVLAALHRDLRRWHRLIGVHTGFLKIYAQ